MSNPEHIQIKAGLLSLAALHFSPKAGSTNRHLAAIVIGHPMTGNGFHAIAYDAAYQGESTGEPRGLEYPAQRAEDIKNVVTYLTTLPEIDKERIGVVGFCASGGYTSYATQGDGRMKALATVSAVCVGRMMRSGSVHPHVPENPEAIKALHLAAGQWRKGHTLDPLFKIRTNR